MTKIIVQHYVENLLKVLKVLKTRTALKRNGLSRIPLRSIRQSANALSKQRSRKKSYEIITIIKKTLKKLLTSNIIKSSHGLDEWEITEVKHIKED